MPDMHIALIYAGGTIGMTRSARGYVPDPDFPGLLQRHLAPLIDQLPRHTLLPWPQPIDSSNARPADWLAIGREIAAQYDDYDGFVVLHGTDTMAYTASALSFMLRDLGKPVILTGSQIPLAEPRSDALANLTGALQLATAGELNEVALFFNQRLLRGNRSTKLSNTAFAAFDSPNHPALAELGTGIHWNRASLLPRARQARFELPDGGTRILSWRFAPGQPLEALEALLACRPDALILECYGAGNIPDREPGLVDLLTRAGSAGVVLVARSQCAHGAVSLGTYASGSSLADAGVTGAGDMSFEAVYAKLHHLFGLGMDAAAVGLQLTRNLAGELTE